MKEYLKMSDAFEGVVIAKHIDDECVQEISFGEECGNCWSIEDDRHWIAVTKEHAEYAAHAINSHDELVGNMQHYMAESERWEMQAAKEASRAADLELVNRELLTLLREAIGEIPQSQSFPSRCDIAIAKAEGDLA